MVLDDVANDAVHILGPLLGFAFRRQLPDALDDCPCPMTVLDDGVQRVANPIDVRVRRRQPVQRGVGVCDDGRQRLVDLVRDRRAELAKRRDPGDTGELELSVADALLAIPQHLLGAPQLGDVACDAAVAGEPALAVEHGLTAGRHDLERAVGAPALEDEVAEGLVALQDGHVLSPLLGFCGHVVGAVQAAPSEQLALMESEGADLLGHVGELVRRPRGPEPVGRRLRVVAEHLLARTQIRVRLLQRPAHGLERRDHVVELVVLRGRSPLQRERWRRPEHVVVTEEAGERREMSRDQPVSEVEDEQGYDEDRCALAGQDDDGLLAERAIDVIEAGLERQHAELVLLAARGTKERELAPHRRAIAAGPPADDHRIAAVGGLAHLDEAHGREAQDPLDLQLELTPIEVPQAFAEAMTVTVRDLGHAAVDSPRVAAVVQIELRQRQDERADDAEQEDPDQQTRTDSAPQSIEDTPGRRHAMRARRHVVSVSHGRGAHHSIRAHGRAT